MRSYRDLIVWQKSMELVKEVYLLANQLPSQERYALSDQMRRAAVSIPSNIAEGHDRRSAKEFHYFLNIARGSKAELETQLEIGICLGYFSSGQCEHAFFLLEEIGKILNAMIPPR